jgi:hypothetical protein
MCDIAEVLGTVLKMPVESIAAEQAPEYFGWLANLAANDLAASSAQTRQLLNWNPTGAFRTVKGVKRRGETCECQNVECHQRNLGKEVGDNDRPDHLRVGYCQLRLYARTVDDQLGRRFTQSIGLSAHGSARLPVNGFGSILAANAAKYAGFTGLADS